MKNAAALIKAAQCESFSDAKCAEKRFLELAPDYISICAVPANRRFINAGFRIEKIYFLLHGECNIHKESADGQGFILNTLCAPQIFGLVEFLGGDDDFSAGVTTRSACCFGEIYASRLLRLCDEDGAFTRAMLSYLASLATNTMQQNTKRLFLDSFDSLLVYIYEQTVGKELPTVIETSRNEMAGTLRINIRTLYRYTDRLVDEGFAKKKSGKLFVDEEAYQKLLPRANEIYSKL